MGQAIDAVTGTRHLGFCFSFLRLFWFYAAAGIVIRLLFRNGSYTSPLTHNRCSKTASFRAVAITARFFLLESTTPIFYRTKNGGKGMGYDATLLPTVAEVYLKFRDAMLAERGAVPKQYAHIISAADILMRALANVGIIALIDEATGYQKDRARNALEKILDAFIAKELRPWVHTFSDDFYDQLFRIRGLEYPKDTVKKPQYFGHLTNDIIYKRLAPSVLDELKQITPRDNKGRHKHQLHRRLTDDIGHPKLREHIASVVTVMKLSDNYDQFLSMLDRAHPRYGETAPLPFNDTQKGL